ncbi:DUF1289 domain-containing protein [Chromobacterium alticapitis]|uniref:DUF1289 domain-containing protein n=1 Tax=Chromobacterium alticapitis TaxID=2073169 RepID=A0A2S5DL08_9NEIS|nr:DUF1289 domain-containing protein [Chromobacterium alticapitis]POZ63709.1 hypothetical protein C2I19_02065 [Chromobacterium alticapitis]
MSSTRPDSPCVALCSTALGDNVCRGCARTFGEISQWCFLDQEAREAVWLRLPQRQRLLKLAAACGALLELDSLDGVEWGRLPNGVLYRLDDGGALLRRSGDGVAEAWSGCASALPEAAAWLGGS